MLPTLPTARLILVATGTGFEPFRAFVRLVYDDWPELEGRGALFHRVKNQAECLHRDLLERYVGRPGFRLNHAFSREPCNAEGGRLDVQHDMADHAAGLWAGL